jgi:hypothetical protein
MFDKELVRTILLQIDEAIERIITRTARIHTSDYFASTHFSQSIPRSTGRA